MKYNKRYHTIALLLLCGLLGSFLFRSQSCIYGNEESAPLRNIEHEEDMNASEKVNRGGSDPLQRTKQLRHVCSQLEDIGQVPLALPKSSYEYFYVNDEHKFIFCMMPKLACTNWKRIFLALNSKPANRNFIINQMNSAVVHSTFATHGRSFYNYNSTEIEERLRTYKKVVFVRDPFTRLVSAYKDKMFRKDSPVFQKIAQKIVRLKRNNTKLNKNVSFLEFIKYLTDADTHEQSYEQHWARYNQLCRPCLVKYNFIGKIEYMDDDIRKAFDFMGIKDKMESFKFPDRKVGYKNVESSKLVDEYYTQIPKANLRNLWRYLKLDVSLFSYQKPSFLAGI